MIGSWKVTPGLALQALEEVDGRAERGGEVEQHRDHEVDRCDQAAQQQREDERDQQRRGRQDHRQVPVVGRVDVGEDRGRSADHRPRAGRCRGVQRVAQVVTHERDRLVGDRVLVEQEV